MSRSQFTSCLILASPPFPPASLKFGSCLKSYTMMIEMQVDNSNAGSPFEAEDHHDLPIRQLPPPYAQPSGYTFSRNKSTTPISNTMSLIPSMDSLLISTVSLPHCASRATGTQQPFAASRSSKPAPTTTWRIFGIIFGPTTVTPLVGLLHLDPGMILPYSHPKH
ncbi:unnamed protein product [Lactuca virosa]|uniref:Uncharacterized protein n=1 Tax=Lactuca virosa TaxID=75947 RepID=A0AAU9LV69_9ASTR|nr:unnamed protein product [Lactuca virosa]